MRIRESSCFARTSTFLNYALLRAFDILKVDISSPNLVYQLKKFFRLTHFPFLQKLLSHSLNKDLNHKWAWNSVEQISYPSTPPDNDRIFWSQYQENSEENNETRKSNINEHKMVNVLNFREGKF